MKAYIRFVLWISGILSLSALASAGQLSGTLSGPAALGYVWSATDGKLHPLLGIPGNTTVGNAQSPGFPIAQALALDGKHFLASTDANAFILSLNLAAVPASITAIVDAPSNPSRAAGSRGGTAAALYYAADQRVLIVTGLPLAPKVAQTIDVSVAGEPLSRMAVSDDGSLLLYSVSQGERDALFGWTPLTGYRLLTTADSISNIALAPNGDAIVIDAKASEVFSIMNPKASATRLFLADDRSGVSNPTSVTVSSAGQIYVANGGSDTILTLDSAGNLLRTQHCGCEVSGLFPLKDSLYRLSDRIDRTLYLLETSIAGDRVVFVPPSRKNQ